MCLMNLTSSLVEVVPSSAERGPLFLGASRCRGLPAFSRPCLLGRRPWLAGTVRSIEVTVEHELAFVKYFAGLPCLKSSFGSGTYFVPEKVSRNR